uniref:E3 ubiquitin-protein ligase NEURL3-like n=1 Tax=Oncorhynchus gorbuscha TaxID=8017 RepID=UPI001EAEF6C9|nr:E3 ubiquitin-protein ligase NEURL3-like [Oncorhynchus gorbuscha]
MGNSKSSEFCPKHGRQCLGPLFFHKGVLGTQVCLSLGGRRVERNRETFRNGLTFSSRPIRVQEKIHLRVELCDQHWNGALRVGFTSIPPSSCGPLFPPAMAIPDLTTIDRYWAAPVPSSLNMPEAELRFWVTPKGVLVCEGPNRVRYLLLEGVDVRSPLWAIIDVYGQTRAVLLLGSKQKGCNTRRSCPYEDSYMCVNKVFPVAPLGASTSPLTLSLPHRWTPLQSGTWLKIALCLSLRASVVLSCGHRCLCQCCAVRVTAEFGICPLCRQSIR